VPSPAEVANFQQLLLKLVGLAVGAVGTMYTNASDSQQLKEAYPFVVDPFIAASATLSAQWYDSLNPDAAFATEVPPPVEASVLEQSVGWALGQADPLSALIGSTDRRVFAASRDTIMFNARRERVRFARYASANACPWCRVLATREAVFSSAENAIRGHDNCHCLAVPVRDGDSYTPPDYVKQWRQDYNDARDEVGGNLNDIVNYQRRQ